MAAAAPPPTNDTTAALLQLLAQQQALNRDQHGQLVHLHKEIARLVRMVEGLTKHLDAALGEKAERERAELARKAEEARAAAEAAARAVATSSAGLAPSPLPVGVPDAAPPTEPAPEPPRRKPRKGHKRLPRPESMPVEELQLHPTACTCGCTELRALDEVVIQQVDYVRAHLRMQRVVRKISRCTGCGARVSPPAPPMPFDRATCTMRFLGWLIFAKLGLFIPLDRLRRDFIDQGARFASATLTRWLQQGLSLLAPVAEAVRGSLLTTSHIQTDATGLLIVLQASRDGPRTLKGQVLFFGDGRHLVFWYAPDKCGAHFDQFLTIVDPVTKTSRLWTGTLISDAANVFDHLFTDGTRVEAGCNAHNLRAFRDEQDKAPLLASRALAFIGGFYRIEREAQERGLTGAALLAHRKQHAGPIAVAFRAWLDAHIDDLLPSHPVRKAMQYRLNHWDALVRFLDDPQVPLDNNFAERGLRKIALLRNNSLYAGGEESAKLLCVGLTLIQTARQLGVDPYSYLVWALERVVPHPGNRGRRAAELTPAAYEAEQQREAEQARRLGRG